MRYIYMAIAFVWLFGLVLNAAYMIPTGKVGLLHLHNFAKLSLSGENIIRTGIAQMYLIWEGYQHVLPINASLGQV